MKNFFKTTLAVITGLFVWTIICFVGFLIFGVAALSIVSSNDSSEEKLDKNTILQLDFNGEITDRDVVNYTNINLSDFSVDETLGLNVISKCIKQAANDDNISALFLNLTNLDCGYATVEEIRNLILKFKTSGKPVFAYAENYDNSTYFLASVADKIFMNPCGDVELTGLSMQNFYLKSALEKAGINMQVVRHGKFKSAVEPYIQDKMSAENELQSRTLINDIWNNILNKIGESRNIPVETLSKFVDDLSLIGNPKFCVDNSIVDSLMFRNDFLDFMKNYVGQSSKKIKTVKIKDYNLNENLNPKSVIAVVYASGEITKDAGRGEFSSSEICKALKAIADDDAVKGVVLRVNSPGGDANEAEIIFHEAEKLANEKPLVVSMGDYAASGGYYISCLANQIFVQPTTITGSIGVFGVIPCAEKLINKFIGVNVETVTTNKHSDFLTVTKPLDSHEYAVMQRSVENVYSLFISHIADYRPLTVAEVDSVGQGRVWSGVNACKIGLADNFGGLDDAIEAVAQLADIKSWKIDEYPKDDNSFNAIFKELLSAKISLFGDYQKDYDKVLKQVEHLQNNKGVKCIMPYFEVK